MNCGLRIASTSMPIFIYYILNILYIIISFNIRLLDMSYSSHDRFFEGVWPWWHQRDHSRDHHKTATSPFLAVNLTWATRDQGGDGPAFLSQRPRSRGERMGQGTCWCCNGKHIETRESTYCTLFGIYLFDVIPAFDLFSVFWIEAASLFLTMDPKHF